jgi:hypothetical protein
MRFVAAGRSRKQAAGLRRYWPKPRSKNTAPSGINRTMQARIVTSHGASRLHDAAGSPWLRRL